jgi:CRISPR-associated endonuclease/helicase Cas3
MVVDLIEGYLSHPTPPKTLNKHTKGVIEGTLSSTNTKVAELAAIFHDVGKMNLGFQVKVNPNTERVFRKLSKFELEYSHHAYISAYAFYCFCCSNIQLLEKELGDNCQIKLLGIVAIIARHHGNLPDFKAFNPNQPNNSFYLSDKELIACKKYTQNTKLPVIDFVRRFAFFDQKDIQPIDGIWGNDKFWLGFKKLGSVGRSNTKPLMFYQETQFAFASLIRADKKDAGYIETGDKEAVSNFCNNYSLLFNEYLKTLNPFQNKPINRLRTEIRKEVTTNISDYLQNSNKRVFDLTAPTGSGKTLSLLSLADEIIKKKGDFRVMYCLPFLSITEQVEKEVLEIFKGQKKLVQRIDSKSINETIQELQEELDKNPSNSKFKELGTQQFKENIFEYPFIITTFVRFFEAFLKNRNADLLKLPSFSNCIFLIDEIQALPPRLYGFFVAYLDAFCKRFNSYAIISTATMPDFELPTESIKSFFPDYQIPPKLLSPSYFENNLFNRYSIEHQKDEIGISKLAQQLIEEKQSVLCIVNTIDDSKDLFEELKEHLEPQEICLLNTHFTPNDRKYKIEYAKLRLKSNKRIVLISTQLIEAGVDIDFPVLYRDMAIIPSIVQSAGRCNRNGKLELGKVVLIHLNNRGKSRAKLIYRGKDSKLLYYTNRILNKSTYEEKLLFKEQKNYFKILRKDLMFGEHEQSKETLNFIELIKEAMFASLGKFKLIDDEYYGESYRIYVPKSGDDFSFDELIEKVNNLENAPLKDYNAIGNLKEKVSSHLKKMSNQVVQIRLKKHETKPNFCNNEEIRGLFLLNINDYNEISGISLSTNNQII